MSTVTADTAELHTVEHWVNGKTFSGKSTRTAPVFDPARGQVARDVRLASTADVAAAVKVAKEAFPAWSSASWARRQTVLFAFREILNARKSEVAALLTSEHGKVTADALGEIARGLEVVEFACGAAHLAKGEYTENVSTGVDVYSLHQALGVVGIISPFNFPAMVPLWFFPIALAAGNTVILKPSEKDPSASLWMARALQEAGLPDGVFNVVNGDKESVDALLEHPDIASISFVGSTPIAKYIY
ncbi:MAG TPA: aldehyde dehydrogenase family protein, partial [Galbitalea sp.]